MFSIVRACPNCGAKNRVGARHLAANARCGACKAAIGPVAAPLDVNTAEFDEIIAAASQPILVDFWAAWCGPCKMAAPEVKKLAEEMAGRALVLKVDTGAHPELGARYRVQAIPNFVVIRHGKLTMQHPGLAPRAQMRQWLEQP